MLWVTANNMLVYLFDVCNFIYTMPCIVCFMRPGWIEIDYTRYIFTFMDVTFGQVLKNPCSVAAIQVGVCGLKMLHGSFWDYFKFLIGFFVDIYFHVLVVHVLYVFYSWCVLQWPGFVAVFHSFRLVIWNDVLKFANIFWIFHVLQLPNILMNHCVVCK